MRRSTTWKTLLAVIGIFLSVAVRGAEFEAESLTNAPAQKVESSSTNIPAATLGDADAGDTNNVSTNAPPYKIPENRIMQFYIPLSRSAKVAVANSKNPPVKYARVAIAVPIGFDPEIPSTILLVNGTSDGDGSSIRVMPAFTSTALRLGCIVIAADGPSGRPVNDNPPWRWAMISTLLEHLHKTWPQSRRWPVISAGYSGGGKWAGVIGAILAEKKYNLIGVFMSSVNQDYASEAAKLYQPATRYYHVPIFISSGTEDKIATPEQSREVRDSMTDSGFSTVRLESFPGGHAISGAELRKAIGWFVELYATTPAP